MAGYCVVWAIVIGRCTLSLLKLFIMATVDAQFMLVQQKYAHFHNVTLKAEQKEIIGQLLSQKDCVVQLPTGFGKSLLFVLPPLMMDQGIPQHGTLGLQGISAFLPTEGTQAFQIAPGEYRAAKNINILILRDKMTGIVQVIFSDEFSEVPRTFLLTFPEDFQCFWCQIDTIYHNWFRQWLVYQAII